MKPDIESVLLDEKALSKITERLGVAITQDYQGKDLLVIGILKGANIFLGDLIRNIDLPLEIDFMAVSSYGLATESSGVVKIIKDLDRPIEDKHVIIIEDIVDTGLTLHYLMENLKSRNALSINVCALLDKPLRRRVPVDIKYKGIDVPDVFIVGYGIDYAEKYRNLPYVATLKEAVYK